MIKVVCEGKVSLFVMVGRFPVMLIKYVRVKHCIEL